MTENQNQQVQTNEGRDEEIFEKAHSGLPFAFVGQEYGISRERVRFIYYSLCKKKNVQPVPRN